MFDMAPNIEVDFIWILGIFFKKNPTKVLSNFYTAESEPGMPGALNS